MFKADGEIVLFTKPSDAGNVMARVWQAVDASVWKLPASMAAFGTKLMAVDGVLCSAVP